MTPGIYFNLDEDDYFAAKAIGSTDLVKLARFPADWWYSSPWNPDKEPTAKKGYDLGKALHVLLLEGEEAYRDKTVLSAFDEYRTKKAKEWKQEQLDAGLVILTEAEDAACMHMAALVANHPDTRAITTGLKELTVFWEEDGILFRARFDSILPAFSLDLKTYGGANTQGRDAYDTAMRMIAMRSYDVQRAHYDRARRELIKLWEAGAIFGDATDQQLADLTAIAARKTWAWVWLFYQRPDHKQGFAPVVMPVGVGADGQPDASLRSGREKINVALKNFNSYRDRFGLTNPWAQINSLKWAQDTDFMPWMSDFAPPQQFPDTEGEDA
jgi:hypothetical protein